MASTSVELEFSEFALLLSVLDGELWVLRNRLRESLTNEGRSVWAAEVARVEALHFKLLASYR